MKDSGIDGLSQFIIRRKTSDGFRRFYAGEIGGIVTLIFACEPKKQKEFGNAKAL